MGATMSTLAVQERFSDLSRVPDIGQSDDLWDALLSAGSGGTQISDSEFFAMISAEEVRRIRELQPGNFEVLLTKAVERLEGLIRPRAVGTNGTVGPQISNCCRIIARVFSVAYEKPKTGLPNWTVQYIWRSTDLGRRCVGSLRELLHMPGYTVALTRSRSTVQLWAGGVGSPGPVVQSSRFSSARTEVVQTLLSVLGQPMYGRGEAFGLDYWTTTTSSPVVLCSLLNYSLSYEPKVWIMDGESVLAQLALTLLMVSVVHLPTQRANQFRKLLAKLHKREDFDHIVSRLRAHLTHDADVLWLSLLWEMVQANSAFAHSDIVVGVVEPLVDVLRATDEDNRGRLAGFALLSLSVGNQMCAEAMGPLILSLTWENHLVLQRPGIELATLVDVLWNVAPSLQVSSAEIEQLEEMARGIDPRNPTVAEVIRNIISTIQLNEAQPAASAAADGQKVQWRAVDFEWDQLRIQWYLSVLWGRAYQTCGRIWAHTDIKLFRVAADSGKPRMNLRNPAGAVDAAGDAALDFVKSTAAKFLANSRS